MRASIVLGINDMLRGVGHHTPEVTSEDAMKLEGTTNLLEDRIVGVECRMATLERVCRLVVEELARMKTD